MRLLKRLTLIVWDGGIIKTILFGIAIAINFGI